MTDIAGGILQLLYCVENSPPIELQYIFEFHGVLPDV
jgi:hypothetical protein